jgi:excisionase family DNA binding protein
MMITICCERPASDVYTRCLTAVGRAFTDVAIDSKRLMTVKDLAGYLRVHTTTVYRQLKRGLLPAFRVGSDWRFSVESIDRWCLDQDSGFMGARGEKKLRLVHSRKNR